MKKDILYTPLFWRLCLASLFFFASFKMVLPEMNDYLSQMGGEKYKGYIIGLFTIAAGLSRPFSGKITDTIGRVPVIFIGAIVSALAGLLYPFTLTVFSFLSLRFFHGFSTGFTPTGTAAYLSDIVPANRRGEAIGMMGVFSSSGMALGPVIGSFLTNYFSIDIMFNLASFFAIVSLIIMGRLKETLPVKQKFTIKILFIKWGDIIETKVIFPATLLLLTIYSFGVVLTITPDLSTVYGIKNKGFFLFLYLISSLCIRFFAGKYSDKNGRKKVVLLGIFLLILANLMVLIFHNTNYFLFSGVLFGASAGLFSPPLYARAIDLSSQKNRGKAMATMYIALELGIGIGAFFSGWIINQNQFTLTDTFLPGVLFSLIAFILLLFKKFD